MNSEENTDKVNLESLNNDVLLQILKYTDTNCINSLAMVSKRFYNFSKTNLVNALVAKWINKRISQLDNAMDRAIAKNSSKPKYKDTTYRLEYNDQLSKEDRQKLITKKFRNSQKITPDYRNTFLVYGKHWKTRRNTETSLKIARMMLVHRGKHCSHQRKTSKLLLRTRNGISQIINLTNEIRLDIFKEWINMSSPAQTKTGEMTDSDLEDKLNYCSFEKLNTLIIKMTAIIFRFKKDLRSIYRYNKYICGRVRADQKLYLGYEETDIWINLLLTRHKTLKFRILCEVENRLKKLQFQFNSCDGIIMTNNEYNEWRNITKVMFAESMKYSNLPRSQDLFKILSKSTTDIIVAKDSFKRLERRILITNKQEEFRRQILAYAYLFNPELNEQGIEFMKTTIQIPGIITE